jgi:hypothetical protein
LRFLSHILKFSFHLIIHSNSDLLKHFVILLMMIFDLLYRICNFELGTNDLLGRRSSIFGLTIILWWINSCASYLVEARVILIIFLLLCLAFRIFFEDLAANNFTIRIKVGIHFLQKFFFMLYYSWRLEFLLKFFGRISLIFKVITIQIQKVHRILLDTLLRLKDIKRVYFSTPSTTHLLFLFKLLVGSIFSLLSCSKST